MLENFFELNQPYTEFESQQLLKQRLVNSNDLRDVLFRPECLRLEAPEEGKLFEDKTFTNVSFSKTTISGLIFRRCDFIDCLFIGTIFIGCEFHTCSFTGCNPFRVTFTNTYIDPSIFEGMLDPGKYSNIGMSLFQNLYDNSSEMRQREFASAAEFNRYKWKRYVLNHKRSEGEVARSQYLKEWLTNCLFYIFAGYGIRSKFILFWALIAVVSSIGLNFFLWDALEVTAKNGAVADRAIVGVIYYTATIPYGVGELTPASDLGQLIFLGEAFCGFAVITLFVTWLLKRVMR